MQRIFGAKQLRLVDMERSLGGWVGSLLDPAVVPGDEDRVGQHR